MIAIAASLALSAVACSDSTEPIEPLRGVNDATAASLCKAFYAAAQDVKAGRSTLSLDVMEAGAGAYDDLAASARARGARTFAVVATDAADATRAAAQRVKDAQRGAAGGAESTGDELVLEAMTDGLRLQLHETTLQLACYSRGISPFAG